MENIFNLTYLKKYIPVCFTPKEIKNKKLFKKLINNIDLVYFSIKYLDNFYYVCISAWNRACFISKFKDLNNISKNLKLLFYINEELKDIYFDKDANMEGTQSLTLIKDKLYVICSVARGYGVYGDGHYIIEIDKETLEIISKPKKIINDKRLDTQPSIIKYNNKYYLFTRYNEPGKRYLKICNSDISENLFFDNKKIISFKYFIYSTNQIIIENNIFIFCTCYEKKMKKPHKNFRIVLCKTKDFENLEILCENYFPEHSTFTCVGFIKRNNEYFVPFVLRKKNIFLYKFDYKKYLN